MRGHRTHGQRYHTKCGEPGRNKVFLVERFFFVKRYFIYREKKLWKKRSLPLDASGAGKHVFPRVYMQHVPDGCKSRKTIYASICRMKFLTFLILVIFAQNATKREWGGEIRFFKGVYAACARLVQITKNGICNYIQNDIPSIFHIGDLRSKCH